MAITKARMQVKRGNESDFDPSQMLPGEWAVSLDTKYVRMCFAPGICVRMATYDAFEADMEEIRDILLEAETIQEAVARIQAEINDTAVVVEDYSILSKSYAVGGTGKRENEDSDNAKYYYEQTKQISQGINGIVPMGTVAFADLPTSNIVNNAMYNVSDAFTSDARFNDGGGIYYGPGNNVIWTAEGKWDVTASSSVTGIKGSAESAYRVGNVNITPSNIGLGNVNNTSDADKPISTATQAAIDALNGSLQWKGYTFTKDSSITIIENIAVNVHHCSALNVVKINIDFLLAGELPQYAPITLGTINDWVGIRVAGVTHARITGELVTFTINTDGTVELYSHVLITQRQWFITRGLF